MDPEADGEHAVPETNEPLGDPRGAPAPATDAAAALIAALVEHGVRHIVLSPGSRSQALALVAAEFETRGALSVHVRIDERVAGFTALGIGREDGMPAAVVCTSGTAAANLLPAALEAHHAGVPLLLLTADRPPELRGVGANQTTRQPGMFAPNVRFEADVPVPEVDRPRRRFRAERNAPRARRAMPSRRHSAQAPGRRVRCTSTCRSASRSQADLPAWLSAAGGRAHRRG